MSSVHGVPGVIGAIAIGFFSEASVNPPGGPVGGADGLIHGNGSLLACQVCAVLVAAGWSGFWTFVILKTKQNFFDLRVTEEEEELGLDLVEHGQFSAYDNLHRRNSEIQNPLTFDTFDRTQSPNLYSVLKP